MFEIGERLYQVAGDAVPAWVPVGGGIHARQMASDILKDPQVQEQLELTLRAQFADELQELLPQALPDALSAALRSEISDTVIQLLRTGEPEPDPTDASDIETDVPGGAPVTDRSR